MVSIFDLSPVQRSKIADSIAAAAANMSHDERVTLIEQLTEITQIDARFEVKEKQKRTAIANIAACKAGSLAERNMINLLEGNLRRAGLSLDEIVEKPEKIDAIFASADRKIPAETRMGIKSQLFRLGVIGK